MRKKTSPATLRPVVFGEVLFDVFPDGRAHLGGAPFNVAWHLEGFGCRPVFISRVGDDERGDRILDAMKRWGMDRRGIRIDKKHPTGEVIVSIDDGEPDYKILTDRAFDFINEKSVRSIAKGLRIGLIYHGTLAARTTVSKTALATLVKSVKAPVFLDVNLRKECWNGQILSDFIKTATWLKLNESEWKIVRKLRPPLTGSPPRIDKRRGRGVGMIPPCALILTRGSRGAKIISEDGTVCSAKPDSSVRVVDTVGAGDAFSAVTVLGLLRGWDWKTILDRAVAFSSRVCTLRGAVTDNREFYEKFLKDWGA